MKTRLITMAALCAIPLPGLGQTTHFFDDFEDEGGENPPALNFVSVGPGDIEDVGINWAVEAGGTASSVIADTDSYIEVGAATANNVSDNSATASFQEVPLETPVTVEFDYRIDYTPAGSRYITIVGFGEGGTSFNLRITHGRTMDIFSTDDGVEELVSTFPAETEWRHLKLVLHADRFDITMSQLDGDPAPILVTDLGYDNATDPTTFSSIRFEDNARSDSRLFHLDDVCVTSGGIIDSDDDGIADSAETNTGVWIGPGNTGTDPNNPDSDNDGLKDGVEDNGGAFVDASMTGTNPNMTSTDGDSLGDGWEIEFNLDPFDDGSGDMVNGDNGDPDMDQLLNSSEFDALTNPRDSDSDNDGLSDVREADELNASFTGTDPNLRDTDGDGLGDSFEIDNGLDALADADFDFDFFSDAHEVLFYGSDPKDENSAPGSGDTPGVGELTEILRITSGVPDGSTLDTTGNLGPAIFNESAEGGSTLDFDNGITGLVILNQEVFPAAGTPVSITGFSWPVNFTNADESEIRVEFYDPGADGTFDGIDTDPLVGSATGSLVIPADVGSSIYYWNFEEPISFTSAGTALAVRIVSSAKLGLKYSNLPGFATSSFVADDGSGTTGQLTRFSIGGTPSIQFPEFVGFARSGTTTELSWTLGSAGTVDLERSTGLGQLDPWVKVLEDSTETSYSEDSSDPAAFFRLVSPD